jgi:hypothetical protein
MFGRPLIVGEAQVPTNGEDPAGAEATSGEGDEGDDGPLLVEGLLDGAVGKREVVLF